MLFSTLHPTAVLLFLFGDRLAAAIPTATTNNLERRIDPDNVFMYSVDYFIKIAVNKPETGTCLFYTQGLTQTAQEFALTENLFTIWDIWDSAFYNRSQAVTNPLREILKFRSSGSNNPDAQIYFTNMSKAYAMLCDLYALVMTDDPKNVIESGIWGQVEKPALQQTGNPGGQVDLIDACDVEGSNIPQPAYWERQKVVGQDNIAVAPIGTTETTSSVLTSPSYSSTMSSTTFITAFSSTKSDWSNSTGTLSSSTAVFPTPAWSNYIGMTYISSSAASSLAISSSLMPDVRRRQKFRFTVLPHSIYSPQELGSMFSDIDLLW